MDTELYKDIQKYEGLYQVSNLGNVKSLPKGDGNGGRERVLKVDITTHTNTSYHRVTLSKNGKTKRFSVHRLVAMCFVPNPDNKPHVNHIDNNGENNSANNLEWVTMSENMQHSYKQGRRDEAIEKSLKAAAKQTTKNRIARHTKLINTIFNDLRLDSIFKITSQTGKERYHARCTCVNCTSVYTVVLQELQTYSKVCPICKKEQQKKLKVINTINTLKNLIVDGLKVTDVIYDEIYDKFTVDTKCVHCGKCKIMSSTTIRDKRYRRKCC